MSASCDHTVPTDRSELPNSRRSTSNRWSGIWTATCLECNADLIDLVGSPHDWYWTSIFMIPEHP